MKRLLCRHMRAKMATVHFEDTYDAMLALNITFKGAGPCGHRGACPPANAP